MGSDSGLQKVNPYARRCEDQLSMAIHPPRPAYTREAIYQQTQRWLKAGVFEEMIPDLRVLLRLSEGEDFEADGGHCGLSHAEIYPGERPSERLRRALGQEGLEGACRGGHSRTPARPAREPGQRGRPQISVDALGGATASDRRARRVDL